MNNVELIQPYLKIAALSRELAGMIADAPKNLEPLVEAFAIEIKHHAHDSAEALCERFETFLASFRAKLGN